MITIVARTRALLGRLRRSTHGLAVVEFALITPVFLIMVTFGIESANIVITQVRFQTLMAGAADNAARVRESIDETDISELLQGAKKVGENIDFANRGRLIVSSIERNAADNGLWLRWQRCDGLKNFTSAVGAQDKGRTDTSFQSVSNGTNTIAPKTGTVVIVVETAYDYKPLFFGDSLLKKMFNDNSAGPLTFKAYRAYVVRQRSVNFPTNSSGIVAKTCNLFSA